MIGLSIDGMAILRESLGKIPFRAGYIVSLPPHNYLTRNKWKNKVPLLSFLECISHMNSWIFFFVVFCIPLTGGKQQMKLLQKLNPPFPHEKFLVVWIFKLLGNELCWFCSIAPLQLTQISFFVNCKDSFEKLCLMRAQNLHPQVQHMNRMSFPKNGNKESEIIEIKQLWCQICCTF